MAVRAIVTITNAKTVVSSTKIEAQTSHLKAQSIVGFSRLESLAAIDENSKNQWKTDEFLLSEVIVSAYTKPLTETLSISEIPSLASGFRKSRFRRPSPCRPPPTSWHPAPAALDRAVACGWAAPEATI